MTMISKNGVLYRTDQSGIAIYFILGILIAMVGMFALVVEIPQQELLGAQAKVASDAAALGAVNHLDGTEDGWQKAALVAAQSLETNLFTNSSFKKSATESWIEFGFIHMTSDPDGEPSDNQFESFLKTPLTSLAEGCSSDEDCAHYDFIGKGNATYMGATVKSIANAVRITVTAKGRLSAFGNLLGFSGFADTNRSAISLVYDQQEFCVAPIAIPACSLFLDTDPHHYGGSYRDNGYRIDDFDPIQQSGREVIFTEASPWKSWTYTKRAFGLNRHLTYHRPPLIRYHNIPGFPSDAPNECGIAESSDPDKKYPNCRADAIFGVLGAPGVSPGDTEPISPFDLEDVFTDFANDWKDNPPSIATCALKARFGAPFRPLENAVDDKYGLLSNELYADGDNPSPADGNDYPPKKVINRALQMLMPYKSSENFARTFYDENNQPKPNFPYTRSTIDESLIRWPPYDKLSSNTEDEGRCSKDDKNTTNEDEGTFSRILLQYQTGNYSHIKPLAHPANGLMPTKEEHGVKEVLAMVIGPAGPDPYCDFAGYLEQRQQINTTPHHSSLPKIIGFVKVILIDYNFDQYKGPEERAKFSTYSDDSFAFIPPFPDRNPVGIQVADNAQGVNAIEHNPWVRKDPPPWKQDLDGTEEGEGDPGYTKPEPTPTPDPNAPPTPTPTPLITAAPEALWDLSKVLRFEGKAYRPKKLGVHPLPLRRFDCEDPEFDGHCHYLQDHPVQYGLGGITAALSVASPMPLFGPRPVEGVTHPILVGVKD